MKDIKIFLKKKKNKTNNMVMKVIKISQKMKKINWLSIEKYYKMRKKRFILIIRKYLNLENFCCFVRESIGNFFHLHLYLKSSPSTKKNVKRNITHF